MRASTLRIAASLLLGTGCIVGNQDFTGKPCLAAADCPAGYACMARGYPENTVCVQGTAQGGSPAAGGSAGEAGTAPRDTTGVSGSADAGTTGGGGPYYCDAVKPILDSRCVSCHGSPPRNGAPSYMRLDLYGATGTVQGAGAQAPRIVARAVVDRTMPPASSSQPSEAELSVLAAWLAAGALECAPSGTGDAGTPPSTSPDSGISAPPADVSFSADVQPILDAYCVSCHNHDYRQGDLQLEQGRSYGDLLGGSRCSSLSIVERYSPAQSVLWLALSDDPSSCAPAMPLNTTGLKAIAPADFAIIEKWIAQGAPYN